jgi:benzoyl-CoA-dihydrodiol lyase
VATLTLDIQEDKGLFPTYKLKLNSYDLGVDIELATTRCTASASSIRK